MGAGSWDTSTYNTSKTARVSRGAADFAYTTTATRVHKSLDPKRIKDKPFGKLESRDSDEHPNSNAVFVSFDVTGSNRARAVDAQRKLPGLMDLLNKYLSDPQVAIAANDDFKVVGNNAIQISDFESDNRVDDHIRNTWLVGNGGGNDGESYDLIMYAAANLVLMDCLEKRKRKGYFFMYADEPIFAQVVAHEVQSVFGVGIEQDLPIAEVIDDLKEKFHVFVVWPDGAYLDAREQYVKLFGEECVVTLQHPNRICELIAGIVGLNEEKVTPASLVTDLVAIGTSQHEADELTTALVRHVSGSVAKSASGRLPAVGDKAKGASRL